MAYNSLDIGFSIFLVVLIVLWAAYKTVLIMDGIKKKRKLLEEEEAAKKDLEDITIKSEGVIKNE